MTVVNYRTQRWQRDEADRVFGNKANADLTDREEKVLVSLKWLKKQHKHAEMMKKPWAFWEVAGIELGKMIKVLDPCM